MNKSSLKSKILTSALTLSMGAVAACGSSESPTAFLPQVEPAPEEVSAILVPDTQLDFNPKTGLAGDTITVFGPAVANAARPLEVRFIGIPFDNRDDVIVPPANLTDNGNSVDVVIPAGVPDGPIEIRNGRSVLVNATTFESFVSGPQDPAPLLNIVELAQTTPDLSILVDALTLTGLDVTLSDPGPFTVFAPNNAAFMALLMELGFPSLGDVPLPVLEEILLYHVVSGTQSRADLLAGSPVMTLRVPSGSGPDTVVVTEPGGNLQINDSGVLTPDGVAASNGIVYIIDEVLDAVSPALTATIPLDMSTDVLVDEPIVLNFNEEVQPGVGSIELTSTLDNRSIDIADPQVSFAGSTVTITPMMPLLNGLTYTVTIPDGAIEDTNSNHFAGDTFSFSTIDAATSVVVNTLVDENGTGVLCSLREAIQTVVNGADFGGCTLPLNNTITFDPTVFVDPGTPQIIQLNGSELVIPTGTSLTIQGPPGRVQIRGNFLSRILRVEAGATATISRVFLTQGNGIGGGLNNTGSAVLNRGSLTLTNSRVSNNIGEQAALVNTGTLVVQNSVVRDNIAFSTFAERGGGIRNTGSGNLTLTGTTLRDNSPNPVSNSGVVTSFGNDAHDIAPDLCNDIFNGGLLESNTFTRCPDRIIDVNLVNAPLQGNGRRLFTTNVDPTNPFTVFDLRALTAGGEVLDGLDFDVPGSLDVSFDGINTRTIIIIDVTPPGSPADRLEIRINGADFSALGQITTNNFLL